MNSRFVFEQQRSIYDTQVNAIIPWACLQVAGKWVGGDPNPGCAFSIKGNGVYTVEKGYYYYKQISRAGQPGMHVVPASCGHTPCAIAAFSGEGTKHPNAIVLTNAGEVTSELRLSIMGGGGVYSAYRTSPNEHYVSLGDMQVHDGEILLELPADSVTTLFQNE